MYRICLDSMNFQDLVIFQDREVPAQKTDAYENR